MTQAIDTKELRELASMYRDTLFAVAQAAPYVAGKSTRAVTELETTVHAGLVAAADHIDRLAADLAKAKAALEQLPKTADGVPIVPGTTLYARCPDDWGSGGVEISRCHLPGPPTAAGEWWYSTKEAALEARRTLTEIKKEDQS